MARTKKTTEKVTEVTESVAAATEQEKKFEFKDLDELIQRPQIEAYLSELELAFMDAFEQKDMDAIAHIKADCEVLIPRLNGHIRKAFIDEVSKQKDPMLYCVKAVNYTVRKAEFKEDKKTGEQSFRVTDANRTINLSSMKAELKKMGKKFGSSSNWEPLMEGLYCAIVKASAIELGSDINDVDFITKYHISNAGKEGFSELFKENGKIKNYSLIYDEDFVKEEMTSKRSLKFATDAVVKAMLGSKYEVRRSDVNAMIKSFHGDRTKLIRKGTTNKLSVPKFASFEISMLALCNCIVNKKSYELDI